MSDRTVIAIGCSTDRSYNFLIPVTALLWREHIGHHPLAFLVGTEDEWRADRRLAVSLQALDEFQISRVWLGRLEGYPDHTLAQNCRQHAAAVETIFPDTYIMPADADLWPLRRDYYHQHDGARQANGLPFKAVSYYANGDHFVSKTHVLERAAQGLGAQTLPTCHLVMKASDWRAIYQPIPGDVTGSIKKTLDPWRAGISPNADAGFALWMSDQQLMTEAVCQQTWFPAGINGLPNENRIVDAGQVRFVCRHGHAPVDRLDRGTVDWGTSFDASKWTDAHLHRAPDSDAHWAMELPIIDALLPGHGEWARKYHEAYVEASR